MGVRGDDATGKEQCIAEAVGREMPMLINKTTP